MNKKIDAYPLFTIFVAGSTTLILLSVILKWRMPFLVETYAVFIHGIVLLLWSLLTVFEIAKRFIHSRLGRALCAVLLGGLVLGPILLIQYLEFMF